MHKQVFLLLLLVSLALVKSANAQEDIHELGTRMVGGTWHLKEPAGEQHTYEWFLGQQFLKFQGKKTIPISYQDVVAETRWNQRSWYAEELT